MSKQEQLHKIECGKCRSIKYVDVVPYVFVCGCMKPRKPGMKWFVCKNCDEGSEVENVLTTDNQCKNCIEKNSVKQLGTIHSGEMIRTQKPMLASRTPGDFELEGYKSESTRTTEALEKIVKLLEEKA